MISKKFTPILLGVALLAIPACKSDSAPSSDSGAGSGTQPGSFSTRDLAGDWTGLLDPVGEVRTSYPFYLRCDANGFPTAGADARSRDWFVPESWSYAWVRPSGAVSISIIHDSELLFLNGDLLGGGLLFSGSYLMLEDGTEVGNGDFLSFLSPGVGNFSSGEHLFGNWRGFLERKGFSARTINMNIGADGFVLSGDLEGAFFTASNGGLPQLDLSLDSVGRLGALHLETQVGSILDFPFLLVNEAGDVMGGAGVETGVGEVFLSLSRADG